MTHSLHDEHLLSVYGPQEGRSGPRGQTRRQDAVGIHATAVDSTARVGS